MLDNSQDDSGPSDQDESTEFDTVKNLTLLKVMKLLNSYKTV